MPTVRANATCVVVLDGSPVTVTEDQKYDTDAPVVRAFPWLFVEPVEEATARPGEKRSTRRPS